MPRLPNPDHSARIGCAGWSIPAQHQPHFGPGDSMLARYASRFSCVEINSSFHRPHQRKTYQRWAESVPAGFRFAVKLPKTISHEQRLQNCGPALDRFIGEIDGLGEKLAGVLVQLPPSFAFDGRVAATFFAMLRRRLPASIACEPRHASWFAPGVDTLWTRHRVSRVAADPAPVAEAHRVGGEGEWRYWRWHGAPRMYYSAYGDEALRALAVEVRADTPAGATPWILFDNTAHGHAIGDALRLQELLAASIADPRS